LNRYFSEPGILQFQKPSYLYKESAGVAELVIERNDGCDGRVTVRYKTKDITAIAGKDYEVCFTALQGFNVGQGV
jgi:solute carrier family 8 (sodium/calcium exchanger)